MEYIKEQLEKINPNYKNEINLKTIGFISNYMIKNKDKLYKKTEFDKAYDRLKKLCAEGCYDQEDFKDVMIRRISMKTVTKRKDFICIVYDE